uniref:Uncharacterized protein n=1 Tax=Avena sativa TaxID=4498 RepID=A0ACD5UUV6_AVESA
MAGLPRTGPTQLCLGLPEEIFGLEILVRLPSKDLARCRTVCRAWCRVASARDLLLAHHRRQPSLALLLLTKHENTSGGDLHAFDHRTTAAGEARLQPVARIEDFTVITVEASCDGLLLLSVCTLLPSLRRDLVICNPTTRQIGRVPEKIHGFEASGLYRHPPTGEYRLLLHKRSTELYGVKQPCYVFALGCSQRQPRCIGRPPELAGFFHGPAMVRGSLHWSWWPNPLKDQTQKKVTVFDTTAESFRLIRSPDVQIGRAHLYEADDTIGMYSSNDIMTAVDIWVMQDYDSEVWSHKYHVQLQAPLASIMAHQTRNVMVLQEERDVFLLYNFGQTLFLADTERKLLTVSRLDGHIVFLGNHRIKESLVRHSFFSVLQGASDDWSFFSWLKRGA